ncbi:hypothetical protein B9Z55_018788 [Caenorhabditis nigoni]|uniref:Uncharacterized protein n=1 Tax=Caenorhabditis nigoni TaxID=1611254 RepID=A0A2G5TGC4_9PELO|nr:hypothetical protein B9Z55_018788 [Caenorhabditis nigoni]
MERRGRMIVPGMANFLPTHALLTGFFLLFFLHFFSFLKEDSGQNEFMVQTMQNFMLIPNITMTMLKNAAKAQKTPSKLQKSYPSWPNFCRFSTWISIFALFT